MEPEPELYQDDINNRDIIYKINKCTKNYKLIIFLLPNNNFSFSPNTNNAWKILITSSGIEYFMLN